MMPAKPTTQHPCRSTWTTITKTTANIGCKRQGSGADKKLAKKVQHTSQPHAGHDGNKEDDEEEGDVEEEEGEEEEPAMSAACTGIATRSHAA